MDPGYKAVIRHDHLVRTVRIYIYRRVSDSQTEFIYYSGDGQVVPIRYEDHTAQEPVHFIEINRDLFDALRTAFADLNEKEMFGNYSSYSKGKLELFESNNYVSVELLEKIAKILK